MLFFKRKKKNNQEMDATFQKVVSEINNLDDSDNPKKIEHFILESCEHIISTAKEVEAASNFYVQLSDNLSDVEKIAGMSDETRHSIDELADNIRKLTKRKQDYKESERPLSDELYFLMQEHENTIVDDIHRMEENERYKSKVEQDINYLEAEKSKWEIEKNELGILLKRLRTASLVVFVFIILLVCSWLVLPKSIMDSIRLVMIIVLFIGVLVSFILFLVVGKKRTEYRLSINKLNQNINLLNIERIRFVNVSKALQYELDIYNVRSSGELTYIWDQYIKMVKEQENYRKNNLDLTYYIERLYRIFKELELKYERKWIEQLSFMTNMKQLRSLKIKLEERRAIIREQIDSNKALIKDERAEVDRMIREYDFYVPEVLEIIETVNTFCEKFNI